MPELPEGLPIYLDPTSLADVKKGESSMVTLALEGMPLKTTLRLALEQLGLTYAVRDGLVVVTAKLAGNEVLADYYRIGHCLIRARGILRRWWAKGLPENFFT